MTLALDTDTLVHWLMRGAAHHTPIRRFVGAEVRASGRLGIVPQVCFELIHVVTDPRRFERPMAMPQALAAVRRIWNAPETVRIVAAPAVLLRSLELLETHGLGRERILDTALAATLEEAGVRRLATLNGADYRVFPFLEIVDPLATRRRWRAR